MRTMWQQEPKRGHSVHINNTVVMKSWLLSNHCTLHGDSVYEFIPEVPQFGVSTFQDSNGINVDTLCVVADTPTHWAGVAGH